VRGNASLAKRLPYTSSVLREYGDILNCLSHIGLSRWKVVRCCTNGQCGRL
jgi:hypothetical protein